MAAAAEPSVGHGCVRDEHQEAPADRQPLAPLVLLTPVLHASASPLGLLGGSFGPVHYAHLALAHSALALLELDPVLSRAAPSYTVDTL